MKNFLMCLFISCLISNVCSTSNVIFGKSVIEKTNIFKDVEPKGLSIKHSNTLSKEQQVSNSIVSATHLKKTEPVSPLLEKNKITEKDNRKSNDSKPVTLNKVEKKKEESKDSKLDVKLDSNKAKLNKQSIKATSSKDISSSKINTIKSKQDPEQAQDQSSSAVEEPIDVGPLEFQAKCLIRVPKGGNFFYYDLSKIKPFKTNIMGAKLNVNFCDYAEVEPCNTRGDFGLMQDSDCVVYSEKKSDLKSWVVEENKFTITMPEGRKCTGKGENPNYYKVKITVKCDEELIREPVIDSASDFDTCKPSIVMRSAHVCAGEKFETWIEGAKLSPGVVTFILIALGLTILLFGNKLRVVFCIVIIWLCTTVAFFIFVEPIFDFPNSCK